MANVRDSDTSLWLHNKLGTSNDTWIGGSICSQLNVNVLRNIRECFVGLQTQVKLKLLLVFLHTPRRNLDEWRSEIEDILEIASLDLDQWVSMLAELLSTFPANGRLNTDNVRVDDNRKLFVDLVEQLRLLVNNSVDVDLLPLECHYLNKAALTSVVGHLVQPEKHFALRRKPKSAALKLELLQKSQETSAQLKKNVMPAVPLRSRGMPRKMDNVAPLKGIPSRLPSGGFSNASRLSSGSVPRTPAGRKEGRVKMLDIAEQPAGVAQLLAKKRRKQFNDEEDRDWAKKQKPGAANETGDVDRATPGGVSSSAVTTPPVPSNAPPPATPDYAASLISHDPPPTPTPVPTEVSASTASQQLDKPQPATPVRHGVRVAMTPFRHPQTATPPPPSPLVQDQSFGRHAPVVAASPATPGPQPHQVSQHQSSAVYPRSSTVSYLEQQQPPPQQQQQQQQLQHQQQQQQQQQKVTIVAQPQENPRRSLALTREQMREAQDMFSTANKVTRPEKALILGFIAGSRENPCPHLGNVVTIKLSENEEMVMQDDGRCVAMVTEIHFQMNYSSGEWRQVKKYCGVSEMAGVP